MRRNGGPSVLRLEEVKVPRPAAHEVLVAVRYIGINPVDAKIRTGKFPAYVAPLPAIFGRDISGVVCSPGPGERQRPRPLAEGTAVFGMLDYERGAYAEYAVGSARELAPVPPGLGLRDAGALPAAALTAWQGLFSHGRLRRGQTVVILGAGGGVGHLAVQFARLRGARVVAVARRRDVRWLRGLGAGAVVDAARISQVKIPMEADLIFDLVGGKLRAQCLKALRRPSRIVATVGPKHMVVKADRKQLEEIGRLVAARKVRVRIAAEFPLERARAAHERLAAGRNRGKLVLSTRAASRA